MTLDERLHEIAQNLNPIDDIFFRKMAEHRPFCQELLQVILSDPKLTVEDSTAQYSITNLQGRSVILDAKCTLGTGEHVNIEVQRADDDDHQRRVRYYTSVLTANLTPAGARFSDVPDVIAIYITRFDIFGAGSPIYRVRRTLDVDGQEVHNGLREIYVNAAVDDGSDIAELMRLFTRNDSYSTKFPVMSERKRQFKEYLKEAPTMNDELRKLIEEYEERARIDGCLNMLRDMVKSGIITIAIAAKQAGMTEENFRKAAML